MNNQLFNRLQWGKAVLSYALLMCFLFLSTKDSDSFSLLGPDVGDGGGNHLYNEVFRWNIDTITFSIDSSFSTAYGESGVKALTNAFSTWDMAFGTDPTTVGSSTESFTNSSLFDLESIALHEVGHALGLSHPDEGDDIGRNFNSSWEPILATGSEVMNSTISSGEKRRDLTSDEMAGLNYLYDPGTPGLLSQPGVGDLNFLDDGTVAVRGTAEGANIDIFAIPGSDPIFGGSDHSLALALNSFIFASGTDGPGIINGVLSLSEVVGGVDIYFNSSQPIGVIANPEPGTLILLASGLAGLFGFRRKLG